MLTVLYGKQLRSRWSRFGAPQIRALMTTQELFEEGLAALAQAEFEQAEEIFGELVTADETNAEAWYHLAVCYLERQRADLAVEALRRALALRPDDAETHYLFGTALGSTGQIDEAAASYRRALALNPAHQKAEEFLIRAESLIESREHFRRALKLLNTAPDTGSAKRQMLNEALREMLLSINIFPNSPARDQIGSALSQIAEGIITEGNHHALPFIVTEQTRLWAERYEQACSLIMRRDWMSALAALREALLFRDEDAFVHHAFALTLFEINDLNGALEELTRALELDEHFDLTSLGRLSLKLTA
jgi:tetratricopeptide (TPR) repeat protein